MGYYPIFVEMQGRRVLLVGGGHVALEKIGKLVRAGAVVTVVAPDLIPDVRAFIDTGDATWQQRPYITGDIDGFEMIMVATDDGAVNATVAGEARAAGIWVNAADDVNNCDFILPSLVQRGSIAIAASTGGTSPALARWLRERLEEFVSDEVVALGDVLGEVRRLARVRDRACAATCDIPHVPPPLLCTTCPNRIPTDAWQEAIDDEVRALLRAGDSAGAQQRLVHTLGIDRPIVARSVASSDARTTE